MAAMLEFLGTPTFDFVLSLRVLNIVVLALLNSGFHHLQTPSKLEVFKYRGFTIKKVLTVVRIVVYATVVFLS